MKIEDLDNALKHINEKAIEDFEHPNNIMNNQDTYINKIIFDKLYKDGYCNRSLDSTKYRANYDGIVLQERNGYLQMNKNANASYVNKLIMNFSLIFGGVAAGVYYVIQIVMIFFC
jgi:hypothetical protein